MTNQQYKEYYNSVLEREFEKIIQAFIKAYKDENGFNTETKIRSFRNDLIDKESNLTRGGILNLPDKYYIDLVEQFNKRKNDYLPEQFYKKFLDDVVPELKLRSSYDIVIPKIYNATKKDTLKHIAIYYAHKRFIWRFFPNWVDYDNPGDLTSILENLRSETEFNVEKESNLNVFKGAPTNTGIKGAEKAKKIIVEDEEKSSKIKPAKQRLSGKLKRYEQYVSTYNHFIVVEKLPQGKAEKITCEKHGISTKTLDRAIASF